MNQNKDELQHHGIPGMKWGIRRYQNKDGSLTAAGKKRAEKLRDEYISLTGKKSVRKAKSNSSEPEDQNKKKTVKDMSDAELREKTTRMNLEKDYITAVNNMKALDPKTTSKGKEVVNKIMTDIVSPTITDVGKQVLKSYLVKTVNDSLKLDDELKIYTNNKKKN